MKVDKGRAVPSIRAIRGVDVEMRGWVRVWLWLGYRAFLCVCGYGVCVCGYCVGGVVVVAMLVITVHSPAKGPEN